MKAENTKKHLDREELRILAELSILNKIKKATKNGRVSSKNIERMHDARLGELLALQAKKSEGAIKLIAAAQDLLEVLEKLVSTTDDAPILYKQSIKNQAKEVIKKATE